MKGKTSPTSTECGAPGRVLKEFFHGRRLRWTQTNLKLSPDGNTSRLLLACPSELQRSLTAVPGLNRTQPKVLLCPVRQERGSDAISTRAPPPIVDEMASLRR